jgi:predicted nuclease of predicted toxin-antitoxin system
MKLLLDEHLSPKLSGRLQDVYPGTSQVDLLDLKGSDDVVLHRLARENGFIIVSKDDDFYDLALAEDGPPKVVILRVGNVTTGEVERILRESVSLIRDFASVSDAWVCEIR